MTKNGGLGLGGTPYIQQKRYELQPASHQKPYREVVNRMRSLKFKEKKKKPRMLYPEKLSLRMKKKQKFYQKKKNC